MISGAIYARIVSQYSDKGSKQAQKDIAKTAKKIDAFNKKVAKAFAAATTAAAYFAYKTSKASVKAAIDDSKSQAILAQQLKNTTGATNEAIAAVEEHISKQQIAAGVADEELRQSFAALATATGNTTDAMYLQNIALDTAAGTGKDLQAVTMALVKAQQGNIGALKKLGIPLDENIIKTKDFAAAADALTKAYGGQAKILGNSDPLKRLQLAYGEVLETLGYALLPVVEEFTQYLISDVFPALEEWIELNESQLQQGLREVIEIIKELSERAVGFAKFVNANKELIGSIAAVLATLKAYTIALTALAGAKSIAEGVKAIAVGVFGTGAAAGAAAPKVGLFAKAVRGIGKAILFVSKAFMALPGPMKLVIIGLTAGAAAYSKIKGSIDDASKATYDFATAQRLSANAQKNAILDGFKGIEEATKAASEKAAIDARLNKIKNAQAAREKADLAKKILLETQLKKLKGFGLTTDETDPKQLNAAMALLARQKKIDAADAAAISKMKENILLQTVRNDLSIRYADILAALADAKIDSKDIAVLAGKWGVTTEAAKSYIETIFAIEDGTISDDEIIQLAKSWGSTQAQAAQYLDFFVALNDGVLSDAEIEKLKSKWKLTEEQVRMYADFVGVVNDGKLEDAEIIKLKDKWKLTTDQVVDYILKIGSPVSYSGTLIEPGRAAELAWLNATAALERYLALLKAGTGQVVGAVTAPAPNTDGNSAAAIAAAALAAVQAAAAADDAAAEVAASEAAVAAAMASALEAASASAASTAELERLFPDLMRSVELLALSQEAKEESGRSFLTDAEMDRILAKVDGASGILGGSTTDSAALDAAEKARIRAMQSGVLSGAGNFQNSMAGNVTVNITVEGSVTAEQDLVAAVREGLLGTQYNGSQINLQAV